MRIALKSSLDLNLHQNVGDIFTNPNNCVNIFIPLTFLFKL